MGFSILPPLIALPRRRQLVYLFRIPDLTFGVMQPDPEMRPQCGSLGPHTDSSRAELVFVSVVQPDGHPVICGPSQRKYSGVRLSFLHSGRQADEQSFPHWFHTTIRSGFAWARVACDWTHRSSSRGGCFGRWRRCRPSLAISDYTTAQMAFENGTPWTSIIMDFSAAFQVIYANDTLGSGCDTGVFMVRGPGRWKRPIIEMPH